MSVIISRRAQADLEEIAAWTRAEDDFTAEKVLEHLTASIEMLGQFPELGAPARDPKMAKKGVRGLARDGFLIFYRPVRGGVRVMRVLRGSRNWRKLF